MIKSIILCTLLVASTFATFSVNFHVHDIDENVFVKGSDGKPVSVEVQDADHIYMANVKVNSKDAEAAFDTTIGRNWAFQSEANPDIDGEYELDIFNQRGTLIKGKYDTLEKVEVAGHHLQNMEVLQANHQDTNVNPQLTKEVSYGFALDRNEQTNFLSKLTDNRIKLEKYGFSFHISEKINQVIFGGPQEFFANGATSYIPVAKHTNLWYLPVASKSINLKNADQLTYTATTNALIDSTTRYIWAEDQLVDSIVEQLNNKGLQCTDVNSSNNVGVYNCNDNQEPTLSIGFTDKNGDVQTYQLSEYTETIGDNVTRLLIRKQASYTKSLTDIPKLAESKTEANLVLGTVFLQNVYTYFDAGSDHLEMAQAFLSNPQDQHINGAARLWYLILGGLVLLGLLAALLYLIKEVPYTAPVNGVNPVKTAPHQIVPQQSLVQQQPVVLQSYVRTVQPQTMYVQQQPQQQVILSPSRVYQTQYVPK